MNHLFIKILKSIEMPYIILLLLSMMIGKLTLIFKLTA